MKNTMMIVLLNLLISNLALARSNASVEAWLSKSSFDGKAFQYQYTAYDTKEIFSEKTQVLCEYSFFQGKPTLAAVQVKVLIDADFNAPGVKVERKGSVDVREGIQECLAKGPRSLRLFNSPVQVKLPPISVPIQGF